MSTLALTLTLTLNLTLTLTLNLTLNLPLPLPLPLSLDEYLSLSLDDRQDVGSAVKGIVEAVVRLEAERMVWRNDATALSAAAAEALELMTPARRELEVIRADREAKALARLDQVSVNDRERAVAIEGQAKKAADDAEKR